MSEPTAKIKATIAIYLRQALADAPIDFNALLAAADLTPDDIVDPLKSIPLNSVVALFDEAARMLNDPGFGINISAKIQPGGAGLLSQLALRAPDAKTALQCAADYTSVYMTDMTSDFEVRDGVGYLTWRFPDTIVAPRVHYNCYMSSLIVRRLRGAVGGEWAPLSMDFDHRAPDCEDLITEVFGDRVRFEQPATILAVDSVCLATPMPMADQVMFELFEDLAKRWLAEAQDVTDIVIATRNEVVALLNRHEADLEKVAGKLGLTPRALQWRLSQKNTTFESVLGNVRESMARHLLQDTNRPLTEIAYDLGYADPSVFTRAAKRWFGVSPRAFRQASRH